MITVDQTCGTDIPVRFQVGTPVKTVFLPVRIIVHAVQIFEGGPGHVVDRLAGFYVVFQMALLLVIREEEEVGVENDGCHCDGKDGILCRLL